MPAMDRDSRPKHISKLSRKHESSLSTVSIQRRQILRTPVSTLSTENGGVTDIAPVSQIATRIIPPADLDGTKDVGFS